MRLYLIAAGFSLAAAAAWADAPIATTSSAQAAPPQPQIAAPPLATDRSGGQGPQRLAMGPCGPERVKPDGRLDTRPHGEIEAGVGTHGYRHLAGRVCQPLGQNAAVTVSASTTQAQWGRR